MNSHRHNEHVATDTILSSTPTVASGVSSAQFYVGYSTMVCDANPFHTHKNVKTLENNICQRSVMNKLVSDAAQLEVSNKVQHILCILFIDS